MSGPLEWISEKPDQPKDDGDCGTTGGFAKPASPTLTAPKAPDLHTH
jgi:hypothetical protein